MRLRFRMAWHVLRGRPLMYRIHMDGPSRLSASLKDALIVDNTFKPQRPSP